MIKRLNTRFQYFQKIFYTSGEHNYRDTPQWLHWKALTSTVIFRCSWEAIQTKSGSGLVKSWNRKAPDLMGKSVVSGFEFPKKNNPFTYFKSTARNDGADSANTVVVAGQDLGWFPEFNIAMVATWPMDHRWFPEHGDFPVRYLDDQRLHSTNSFNNLKASKFMVPTGRSQPLHATACHWLLRWHWRVSGAWLKAASFAHFHRLTVGNRRPLELR